MYSNQEDNGGSMPSAGELSAFNAQAMTDVVRRFPRPNLVGKTLFPEKPWALKTVTWEIVSGTRTRAKFSPKGSEAHISPLLPRSKVSTELLTIREKKTIDEATRQFIAKPGSYDQPYGDQAVADELESLDRMVENAREWARFQALVNGQLDIQQADPAYYVKVDYNFDSDHKATPSTLWSTTATATPLTDILDWRKLISRDTGGVTDVQGYLNWTVMNYLVQNTAVQTLLQYTVGNQLASEGSINRLGGVDLVVYDVNYVDDAGAVQQYIPDNKFLLIAKTGMGYEYVGPTDTPSDSGLPQTTIGKVAYSWTTKDPVDTWILVGTSFIPAIVNPDNIVSATIA